MTAVDRCVRLEKLEQQIREYPLKGTKRRTCIAKGEARDASGRYSLRDIRSERILPGHPIYEAAARLAPSTARFDAMQLNRDEACTAHTDRNAPNSWSWTLLLGDFSGGELMVETPEGTVSFGRKGVWHRYDARQLHWVAPFKGTRLSLTAFTRAPVSDERLHGPPKSEDEGLGGRFRRLQRGAARKVGLNAATLMAVAGLLGRDGTPAQDARGGGPRQPPDLLRARGAPPQAQQHLAIHERS